jgi:hypothetical protein
MMHTLGIIPGQPFNPDSKTKKILDEAATVGNLMAKNIAYNSPVKESFIYYPGKNWELGIMTQNPSFEDERNATQIYPRLLCLRSNYNCRQHGQAHHWFRLKIPHELPRRQR